MRTKEGIRLFRGCRDSRSASAPTSREAVIPLDAPPETDRYEWRRLWTSGARPPCERRLSVGVARADALGFPTSLWPTNLWTRVSTQGSTPSRAPLGPSRRRPSGVWKR